MFKTVFANNLKQKFNKYDFGQALGAESGNLLENHMLLSADNNSTSNNFKLLTNCLNQDISSAVHMAEPKTGLTTSTDLGSRAVLFKPHKYPKGAVQLFNDCIFET